MAKKPARTSSKSSALIIIVAAAGLMLSILFAQHLYPNYSLNNNYISDLGVGSTALLFNTSMQVFGILLLIASYLMYANGKHRYAAFGFALVGIGAIGVGTFPETTGAPHIISAIITFGTVTILALAFSRVFKGYLAYYSFASGLVGVFVIALFILNLTGASISIGLGHGGVEEILFYDELIWAFIAGISFFYNYI